MWVEAYEAIGRKHPDVVAIFESPHGKLAVLLRQSLVPPAHERHRWLRETRRAANALTADLRAAGATDGITVLQWRPVPHVGHILHRWTCRYDANPARRAELTDGVDARLRDRHLLVPWKSKAPVRLASSRGSGMDGSRPALAGSGLRTPRPGLLAWYRDMAPTWLGAEPIVRRHLILRTHRWIVERVLGGEAGGDADALGELGPTGALTHALVATVPRGELGRWRPWIRLVRIDLQRALSWPPADRSDAWARWLFLIPYAIPVGPRGSFAPGPTAAVSGE
jgi:hypothetical protein